MSKDRWLQILSETRHNAQLRNVLAEFLVDNNITLKKPENTDDGPVYSVEFDRPHIEKVERSGRPHWAVKA